MPRERNGIDSWEREDVGRLVPIDFVVPLFIVAVVAVALCACQVTNVNSPDGSGGRIASDIGIPDVVNGAEDGEAPKEPVVGEDNEASESEDE